jgi:5-formyltetrahydrofolate cyclo-ligase
MKILKVGEKVGQLTKQELRKRILDIIKTQKEEDTLGKSRVILDKVLALPVFGTAQTIMFYASFQGEVDTFALMEQAIKLNKRVVLPIVRIETAEIIPVEIKSTGDLKRGAFGIPEPAFLPDRLVDAQTLELIVVPGVAFDRKNFRLGRGAGFYDRFLARLPFTIPTVGLAYDFQMVDAIPGLMPHDRPVSQVITN